MQFDTIIAGQDTPMMNYRYYGNTITFSDLSPKITRRHHERIKYQGLQMELKNRPDANLQLLINIPFSVAHHKLGADRFFEVLKELYEKRGMSAGAIANLTGKAYSTVVAWLHLAEKAGYLTVRPRIKPFRLEIPVGDKILEHVKRIVDKWEYHYLHIDYDLSYIFGFYLGDGYASDRTVHLMGTKFEMLSSIKGMADRIAKRIGVNTGILYFDMEKRLVTEGRAYSWDVAIYSVGLRRAFTDARGRELLQAMMKEPLIYPCVAGFLDADGSVAANGIAKFSQAGNKMWILRAIREGLIKNGIFCSEIYLDAKRAGEEATIRGRKTRAGYDKYGFVVLHKSAHEFAQRCQQYVFHPKKRERLKTKLKEDNDDF